MKYSALQAGSVFAAAPRPGTARCESDAVHPALRCHYFSLIELMVVIIIILLISGITLVNFGKTPSFATMDSTVRELENLFAVAGRTASVRGEIVSLYYEPDKHGFFIEEPTVSGGNQAYLQDKYHTLYLSEDLKISFRNHAEKNKVYFRCFADGTAAGPDIEIRMDNDILNLKFSPLTGNLRIIKDE